MRERRHLILVSTTGKPLDTRIAAALERMVPRLLRQFPSLHDDTALSTVLEEAGRRVDMRQQRSGELTNLPGYAWVTLRSVAISFIRRGPARLVERTLDTDASGLISLLPAATGSSQDIEREILLREVLEKLTTEERRVCMWKTAGFSSQEIAQHLGRSVVSVDTIFSRAKARLRKMLTEQS